MSKTNKSEKFYKSIIVKMETDTQYQSIKPVLEEFLKKKISFDIYIPKKDNNTRNVNKMYEKTSNIVKGDGFHNIIRVLSPENYYHLALIAPHYEEGISARYYIKYSYGSSHSVKPNKTHQVAKLNHYHGYLLYNRRDVEIFSAFCKTYLLPDLKHIEYKRTKDLNTSKQTILFLPSWEGQMDLDWIISTIQMLKNKYETIVKLHPYGDFGGDNIGSTEKAKKEIKKIADEYYGGEADLSKLLGKSDLVVSDISGAVFDALYIDIPVVMYSKNIHQFDAEGIMSANAKYADEGYISVATTVHELVKNIPEGLSKQYRRKQRELSARIFKQNFSATAVDSWMKVIYLYLNDKVDQEYIALHDIITNDFWYQLNRSRYYLSKTEKLNNELRDRDRKILKLQSEINSFLSIKRSVRLLAGNIKRKIKSR